MQRIFPEALHAHLAQAIATLIVVPAVVRKYVQAEEASLINKYDS
jgi:hypothetical protein